jgi:hypothetical protein
LGVRRGDAVLGRALVRVFLPFLEALVASPAAPATLRRHFGNVWVLGGCIVRQVALEGRTRRAAARDVVLEEVDEDGGPWIADVMTEEEQRARCTCDGLSDKSAANWAIGGRVPR